MALALSAGLLMFFSAVDAEATPIRPNIRKIVRESQARKPDFVPARAGWNGPEMQHQVVHIDPALDPTITLRANKAALLTAAIPDLRAVFAVVLVIFLMRLLLRVQEEQKRRLASITPIDDGKEQLAA